MVKLDNQLTTPIEYFYKWEEKRKDEIFLRQPYGATWKEMTYHQAGQEARKMASALRSLGLNKGDHIALISKNCHHWVMADLAIMMAGLVSVPLYPSLDADQLSKILEQSDAKGIIIGKLDKWKDKVQGLPSDIPAIKFPHYNGFAEVDKGLEWDKLVAEHEPMTDCHVPSLTENWTIIYTSGTTGTPKGVVHTYTSPATVARSEELNNNLQFFTPDRTRFFSFLPLNHIAERTAVECGALMSGGSLSFAENIETFAKNLQETSPTFFFAVPRLWKKFEQGILGKMPQKKLNRLLSIPFVSGMVKKKIRKGLGLSDALCLITGASMTPESLKQWYARLGLNLREGYGMTENMGAFSNMPAGGHRPNTVGKVVANCECKIDPETQEILMKTPWTMKEYYKDPELTAETIKGEWLHSGDKGTLDADGYIKIIGRVKDAFKTAKGKFIVPTTIEEKFSTSEYIEQICVAGLGTAQPVALVNLSEGCQGISKADLHDKLKTQLDDVNKQLHAHEKIASIVITKDAWTDENKLLTPTLKIKRGSINDRYGHMMNDWCDDKECIIWE